MEHTNALPVGTMLIHYKILSVLGQGGFGITYKVLDTHLDKTMVIKEYMPKQFASRSSDLSTVACIPKDRDTFEWGMKRFLEEARVLSKFDHISIVKAVNFINANGTAYFVMDFYEGQTLEDYINQHPNKQYTQDEILSVLMPIIEGLKAVHEQGFLHRDIAPDNIFLRINRPPILIDFGASRNALGTKSQNISAIVKHGYSPPEQYTSDSAQDTTTDLYAISAVMYEMITGKRPPESTHRQTQIFNNNEDPIENIVTKFKGKFEPSFLQTIQQGLSLRQKERIQTIREYQEGLVRESEIEPPPPPPSSSNRGIIVVIMVAIIVILGGILYQPTPTPVTNSELVAQADTKQLVEPTPIAKVEPSVDEKSDTNKSVRLPHAPSMIRISAGSYTMGSDSGDDDKKPPHRVEIGYDFEIGKYEVTIGEYKECVADGGCRNPEWLEDGSKYHIHTGSDDYYKKMCLEDTCPIIGVSWDDAKSYTQWLSQKRGERYRLPTEAEWEYVARAGTATRWSFGSDEKELGKYGWYNTNSDNKTHPVGEKLPNPWGLHDIHGNVWEWCEDWYTADYKNTPKDGTANNQGAKEYRVLRGGSWIDFADWSRSSVRFWYYPAYRDYVWGFRLLRTYP